MKRTRFQQRVVFFEEISCKTLLLARYPYNLEKGRFWHKLKWNRVFNSELYSLSTFDQNAFLSKISLWFGKRKFWTQNAAEQSFQQRVVFLWGDFIQNAFLSKIFLSFCKRKFWKQNEAEHCFQNRLVFF